MKRIRHRLKQLSLLNGTEFYIAFIISLIGVLFLISIAVGYFSKPAAAADTPATVPLGLFDGDNYAYETSTIEYYDNIRLVWVMTPSQKFNPSKNPEYAFAAGRFAIDCSGHTSVFVEAVTFNKQGKILQHGTIPKDKWVFLAVQDHTPQYTIYRNLCADHPII